MRGREGWGDIMPCDFVMVSGEKGVSKTILASRTNESLERFCSASADQFCELHSVTGSTTGINVVARCIQ